MEALAETGRALYGCPCRSSGRVFFIISPFLVKSFDVMTVWSVLDVLMVIGLATGPDF